ncbi:MAG: LuxR C-terminal-related transcriptional regulator [Acidimicrobiales bacterium]
MTIDDLTLHESDGLEQMAHGLSNRAIARELNASIKAIEKYSTAIFRKLDLADRSDEDRRVSATLAYLRAYAGPFRPTTGNSPPGT